MRVSVESKSAKEEAVNALSWLYQAAELQPVSGAPSSGCTLAQPKVCKEPMTADMLKAMVDAAGS